LLLLLSSLLSGLIAINPEISSLLQFVYIT
jgi:hypothetical protein